MSPPLFEYHCQACEHRFESLSRAYEPVQCPACRTFEITKLISMPAVIRTETQTGKTTERAKGK